MISENRNLVLMDLFSGYGGFHIGLCEAGFQFTKTYFSEKDKHAIANYRYNFPEAQYLGTVEDVKNVKADIVTFGFPCQDLSIAGKRAGLSGKRSGLFYQATRVLRESDAKCFIWENVAGLLSSNGGADIEAVCEELYLSGYLFDINAVNTLWWLPQNRLRLFSVGYNIKHLQQCLIETNGVSQNYNLFVKTIQGLLINKLENALIGARRELPLRQKELVLENLKETELKEYGGLRLKKKLLKIISTLPFCILKNLSQIIPDLQLHPTGTNTDLLQKDHLNSLHGDTKSHTGGKEQAAKEEFIWNIELLLKKLSDESLLRLNKFIILTLLNQTTKNQIYSIAEIEANIELFIIQLTLSLPHLWNEALSNLTGNKNDTSYAKNRRGKKGTAKENSDATVRLPNGNTVPSLFVGLASNRSGCEIFPLGQSDENADQTRPQFGDGLFVQSLDSSYHKGPDGKRTMIKYGTSQDQKLSPLDGASQTLNSGHYNVPKILQRPRGNNKGNEFPDCPTISSNSFEHNNHVVQRAPLKFPGRNQKNYDDGDYAFTVDSVNTGGVNVGGSIRRLTPIECERLHGLPDDFLKYGNYDGVVKEISDTNRYKMAGNGVSIPPVKAIGEKLIKIFQ